MKKRYLLLVLILCLITFINLKGFKLFVSDKSKKGLIDKETIYLNKLKELDKYYSSKQLGSFVIDGKTFFRLFAPNAQSVTLITFQDLNQKNGDEFKMEKDKDGVWEAIVDGEKYGIYYGFKIAHENSSEEEKNIICIDPYAKAVATFNTYFSPRRAIVVKENEYDWKDDKWIQRDWRDLIIYEMHIRDMSAHSSSGSSKPGTYRGLIEKGLPAGKAGKSGGIDYIKSLGVNTVELLPAQEFANIEIPFNDSLNGKFNSWNPYERNHWGYMTAAFFAPEAYYSEAKLKFNSWSGGSAKQVNDFKDMVKAFHKEGIGVIMDVVYNHLSEYEIGNLKQIDKEYYFRLDRRGNYVAQSGTGNDLKTDRPMLRRLIIESVLFWMKEYHIDGFRFDLGKLIDWETIEEITREAKRINPNVVFVCEPWGGGYDPMGFSLRGWGSWNDQIRNGVKGENPVNGSGWIFGNWHGNNNPDRIKSYVNGTLVKDKFGLFQKKEHSINYLESHDGYTLGDFIRIALGDVKPAEIIKDVDKHVKLSPLQMKLNKLAALFLFTSQGITMIHSGQEFARSKVVPLDVAAPDNRKGMIDHNSYDKDNETNYINYNHAKINEELLNYYKGLISLRNKFDAFRRAEYDSITFYDIKDNPFALGYHIDHGKDQFIVLFNANPKQREEFILPEGKWNILVNGQDAGVKFLGSIKDKIVLEPTTGCVLLFAF